MYSWSETNDTKINWLICDVIQDFLSLQELSHNIQDYSHNATPPAFQMKWFLCHVISLHCWWKRWEILSCCRSDPVFYGGIHKVRLLRSKIKWLICHVIRDYHLIGGRQNRTIHPRQWMFLSIWSESSVIWYI